MLKRRWWLLGVVELACVCMVAISALVVIRMAASPLSSLGVAVLAAALSGGFFAHLAITRALWWCTRFDARGISQPGVMRTLRAEWKDIDGWRRVGHFLDLRSGTEVLRIYLDQFGEPELAVQLVLAQLVAHNPERWLSRDGGNARAAD